MNMNELIQTMDRLARPRGYRHKGGLFWATADELTVLIQLQRSRWGAGIYVNFGVMPTQLITKNRPPSVEYWPLQERGETFESPYKHHFEQMAMDERSVTSDAIEEAINWLVGWIDRHLRDPHALRTALYEPSSWLSQRGPMQEGILADWARDRLRDPIHYYQGLPYYR